MKKPCVQIAGVGAALPERVVKNSDLQAYFNTSDQWIREKIGIEERRFVKEGEGASDLAVKAAQVALENAGWGPSDIEAIVVSSSTPDYQVPGVGVFIQDKLGCRTIPAYDLRNSSPGFLFAMEMATALLETGRYKKILVTGVEVHSPGLDFSDRGRLMSVIFGDGAGAFLLKRGDETLTKRRLPSIETRLFSEGKYFDKLWCEAPSFLSRPYLTQSMIDEGRIYPKMDGRFIFEEAPLRMANTCQKLLSELGLSISDIDWLIPHQANLRIIERMGERLGISRDKVITVIEKTGNLSSASIPLAFATGVYDGRVKRGDLVLAPSFGSGFSFGAMALEF